MRTLEKHAQRCKEPVARLSPGIYEHRGYRVVQVRDGWRVLQGERLLNEYQTLGDALDGVHDRPPLKDAR